MFRTRSRSLLAAIEDGHAALTGGLFSEERAPASLRTQRLCICSACARGAPDVLVPQHAGRIFSRSLHGAQEGRTQPRSFAAIARSSARAHDLISGQLTRAPCLSRPRWSSRPPVLDGQQVGMLGHGAKRGHHIHLTCISSKSLGPYTPQEAAGNVIIARSSPSTYPFLTKL
jgi:hypothetical protein